MTRWLLLLQCVMMRPYFPFAGVERVRLHVWPSIYQNSHFNAAPNTGQSYLFIHIWTRAPSFRAHGTDLAENSCRAAAASISFSPWRAAFKVLNTNQNNHPHCTPRCVLCWRLGTLCRCAASCFTQLPPKASSRTIRPNIAISWSRTQTTRYGFDQPTIQHACTFDSINIKL